jgi:CRISPR/Cas system-associated protein Cas10 (large subunit of type III CRISPR-Cas system)
MIETAQHEMKTKYEITTQRELRKQFWLEHPNASRNRYGTQYHKDYATDTRCAWCDFIDAQQKCGRISETLAAMASLAP